MSGTWILAADSSRARLFETGPVGAALQEIEEFDNPEARAANRDLRTDAQGRMHGSMQAQPGKTAAPQVSAVQHETELFAKFLADYLDKARNEQRFARLCVIAPPKFLGLLRAKFPAGVQKLVTAEIGKDLSAARVEEIGEEANKKLRPALR